MLLGKFRKKWNSNNNNNNNNNNVKIFECVKENAGDLRKLSIGLHDCQKTLSDEKANID